MNKCSKSGSTRYILGGILFCMQLSLQMVMSCARDVDGTRKPRKFFSMFNLIIALFFSLLMNLFCIGSVHSIADKNQ